MRDSKKNDEIVSDEETSGFVEKSMRQDNEKKIEILANSVSAIKNISKAIGAQLKDEEPLT